MWATCAGPSDLCQVSAIAHSLSGIYDTGILLEVQVVTEFATALLNGHKVGRTLARVRSAFPDVPNCTRRRRLEHVAVNIAVRKSKVKAECGVTAVADRRIAETLHNVSNLTLRERQPHMT